MLRYPGGKYKCRKLLHSLAPRSYKEWREPFLGGANLIWEVPEGVSMWLNDKNIMVVRFWEALRDDDTFIDRMMELKERLTTNDVKRREFEAAKAPYALDYDPLAYWLLNRYASQAIVSHTRKNLASFGSAFIHDGLTAVTREKLERLRSILRRPDCRLTVGDYAPLIETPGDGVVLFFDPPYLMNHHSSPIYEEYMSEQEHVVFAERLRACPHKWLLTIGNCRLSRDLYRGFRILVREYTGLMPHRTPDRNRTELIVMNY